MSTKNQVITGEFGTDRWAREGPIPPNTRAFALSGSDAQPDHLAPDLPPPWDTELQRLRRR